MRLGDFFVLILTHKTSINTVEKETTKNPGWTRENRKHNTTDQDLNQSPNRRTHTQSTNERKQYELTMPWTANQRRDDLTVSQWTSRWHHCKPISVKRWLSKMVDSTTRCRLPVRDLHLWDKVMVLTSIVFQRKIWWWIAYPVSLPMFLIRGLTESFPIPLPRKTWKKSCLFTCVVGFCKSKDAH